MNNFDQTSLLHIMETGIISETKVNKTREVSLSTWVFGSTNSCEKIPSPLLSRFFIMKIPQYTFIQFKEIVVSRLKDEEISEDISIGIAEKYGMNWVQRTSGMLKRLDACREVLTTFLTS